MKATLVLVAVALFVVALAQAGNALKCWKCSNNTQSECTLGSTLKNDFEMDCPAGQLCHKNIAGNVLIRDCKAGRVGGSCNPSVCDALCDKDLCNGQPKGTPSLWLGLLSMALGLLFIGKY